MTTATTTDTTTIKIEVPNASIVWNADCEGLLPEQDVISYEFGYDGDALSQLTALYCDEFSEELDRLVSVDDLLLDAKDCQAEAGCNKEETAKVIAWLAALRVAFPDLQVHIYTAN